METAGSRPSPKLRAFLQTSHSGIHDVARSAASQLRGSLGRQHKSLIVRGEKSGRRSDAGDGEGKGVGAWECPSRSCPSSRLPFARIARATASLARCSFA
uniref:Uncharacterized protein n=1 Tax=Rangifer tarandus platyrhynchus TaxID=3082113 RepID=A0ACB0FII7_RANTA|nr:unnamed protein product [Rangifer tarandus platyrhynchus]